MPDQPNNLWKAFWFQPDLTEPKIEFQVRAGTFLDKFFTLAIKTNRYDSEQEEWLRYGKQFYERKDD